MSVFRRVRSVAVESVVAGGVIGIIEGVRVMAAAGGGPPAAWGVVAALAAVGAVGLAVVVHAATLVLERVPPVARWLGDLAAVGERRVRAVGLAALGVAAVLGFGYVTFHLAAWAHDAFRFNDAGPVGLLLAVTISIAALAVAGLAGLAGRHLLPRLGRHARLFDGRGAWLPIVLAGLVIVLAPVVIVLRAVPAMETAGVSIVATTVGVVIGLRAYRFGADRRSYPIAILVGIGAIVGTAMLGRVEPARGALVVHGSASKAVARALWSLADRDGDGYPPAWIGGADCDDADPARSPGHLEIAGNGVDDNCTGTDVGPEVLVRPERVAAGATGRNIVVISVDALRADHLGAWGYERATSPAIDAFASGAARFAWAMTSSPSTRHAIPSMFTGRYASAISRTAPPPSLAEVVRHAGYETAAVLCCQPLVAPRELRGFVDVDTSADATRRSRAGQANADAVADAAVEWLGRAHDRPFLLWVHFYDPHHPYAAPAGSPDFGDADVDRYDAEIAFADRGIGRVLAALEQGGLAATTIVALTSDHGDEFGEHGLRFHARSLFNQVTRVPLIVRAPDSRPGVIETPVSLVDLAPTLYELAGLGGPAGMNGVSLAPAIRGTAAAPERPVLLELVPDRTIERDLVGIVSGGWKAIWDREANAWSLFSLADPDDLHDRAAAEPAILAAHQRLLYEALDRELATPAGTALRR